ncbi:MAG: LEA type 2 family protein [Flavobacteriales bacterium]|nr:LEA type 2 family protein [Flavobacteriales bacterium]
MAGKAIHVLPAIPLFLAGCVGYDEVSLVAVNGVELQRFDRQELVLVADVVVDNPNGYKIELLEPDVDLYINRTRVGKCLLDSAVVLQARSQQSYRVPLRTRFEGQISPLLIAAIGMMGSGELALGASGTVVGKAGLFRRKIPFELEQMVRLER